MVTSWRSVVVVVVVVVIVGDYASVTSTADNSTTVPPSLISGHGTLIGSHEPAMQVERNHRCAAPMTPEVPETVFWSLLNLVVCAQFEGESLGRVLFRRLNCAWAEERFCSRGRGARANYTKYMRRGR